MHRAIAQRLNKLVVVVLIVAAFGAGWSLRGQQSTTAQEYDFTLLREVEGLVASNYVSTLPDPVQMEYAAIRGYLQSLGDPYTFFIDPPVAQSESDALAGRYGGIGVEVKRNEAGLIVLYPYPDSPAERAGVLAGDVLLDVNDGQLQGGESVDQIRQLLRGEIVEGANNGVTITVLAPDATEPRTIFIAFEEISVPSVLWRVLAEDTSIGYIQIRSFTARTPEELATAITELEAAGTTALILDLRENYGGLLEESIQIADMFLAEGLIFREQKRDTNNERTATPDISVPLDMPIYILVNNRTASAAEVVVGALQDNNRAQTVGQKTVGKGSVQYVFALSDGSSVHITAAIWLTPAGTPINGVGIEPTIPMIPDANGRDVELGEAIRRIQQANTDS